MTTAPGNLSAVRSLLLDSLQSHGLEPAAVGIVGDPAHRGGYHCGSDRVLSPDYSVNESTRDSSGLSGYASALDVGSFTYGSHNLRTFSAWCVEQCKAGAPDTRDIREIIYSADGQTVRRWDRLGRRSSGDSSHLWHTHLSFHRDATKAGRDLTPLFRRYLTTIGLLEDELSTQAESEIHSVFAGMFTGGSSMGRTVDPDGSGARDASNSLVAKLDYLMAQVDTLKAQVATLSGKDFTDEAQVASLVLSGLSPESIAAAIPADLATRVADEIGRRLSGDTAQA